jgi:hypothetical protein
LPLAKLAVARILAINLQSEMRFGEPEQAQERHLTSFVES